MKNGFEFRQIKIPRQNAREAGLHIRLKMGENDEFKFELK